jgi:hypothetical protein
MYETDALHKRGRALEDEFFHRVDEELRHKIRQKMQREHSKETLAQATGFTDDGLLDHLVEADFTVSNIAALALVPMVWVAWADGMVSRNERQAILHTSLTRGLENQPTALHLIEDWINKRPSKALWNLWKEYAEAIKESLTPATGKLLAAVILNQSKEVAVVSASRLGQKKISKAEQKVLDEIATILGQEIE